MSDDQRTTDSIPRAAISQIVQVLAHLAAGGGRSTFDQVRLFLLKRSQRSAPSSPTAMYTVARDVLIELQKLGLITSGIVPRKQSDLETHSQAPCELTEAGRDLADLHRQSPGRAFDHLLLAWANQHSYFRIFISRLYEQPLYVPDITSIKQLGTEVRAEENLDTLAQRISDHCLRRLAEISFPPAKCERFTYTVGERVQELGRVALAGLDAKKWVDAVQDKVVIPALLTAEGMPFSDAVSFQHILKAGQDFFAASWTSSHPTLSLRVVFSTCDFQPPIADGQAIAQVIHHGKSFAAPRFVAALKAAYDQVAKPTGAYANAYAIRALVCIELRIQPKVFAACLADLIAAGPTSELTIYTELPFDPPPQGEKYIEIDRNRIGLLKLTSS